MEATMGYIEQLRKLIGNQPLILPGAVALVINDKNQYLLQQRPEGIWSLPGGVMELGESAEETARREVYEETGIKVGALELVDVFSGKKYFVKLANGDEFYPVTIAYVTKDIIGGKLQADGVESIDVKFFSTNEFPERTSPLIKKILMKLS